MGIRFGTGRRSKTQNPRQAGGGCLIVFGLFFGGIGLVFFVFVFRMFLGEAETYGWDETPCEIQRCEIEASEGSNDNPFRLAVEYRYRFEGRQHVSDQYTRQGKSGDEYEKLALLRRELLRNPDPHCYVNPEAPAEAVLRREGVSMGLFSLFPLIFVTIGFGIVWGGVVSLRKEKAAKEPGRKTAISGDGIKKARAGWIVGAAVGAIFTLVGLGVGLGLGLGPLKRMIESRGWVETPCTVIWSRVQSHDSDDGTTYSVDIFYEYEFNGVTHRSNRYEAMGGSSSGSAGKHAVVRQYPKGSRQVCYVNPELPEQAILKPGFSPWALILLLPLVFLAIGLGVLLASLKSRRKQARGIVASLTEHAKPSASPAPASGTARHPFSTGPEGPETGPVILAPHAGRWMKLGGVLFFALFWNGIVSVFLVQVVKGWQSGNGEIFLTLFLIPFVLIGLGALAAFCYQLLALANPKPVIVLESGHPRLGEPMTISWTVSGRTSRVVDFRISVWGIESATYRRGTDTVTSHEVFYEQTVAETAALNEIESGTATITIPGDLMYSLKLGNNAVKYELRVKGDIPLWPDIGDTFELTLLPRRLDPV